MELDTQGKCRRGKGGKGEGMLIKGEWWWVQCNTSIHEVVVSVNWCNEW
jgi:hypothetical protein